MKHTESGAMTGQQLLELLQTMNESQLALPVHFAFPSGDYWKTVLTTEVSDVVDGAVAYNKRWEKFEELDEDKVAEAERELKGAIDEGEEGADLDSPIEYNNQPILKVLIIR